MRSGRGASGEVDARQLRTSLEALVGIGRSVELTSKVYAERVLYSARYGRIPNHIVMSELTYARLVEEAMIFSGSSSNRGRIFGMLIEIAIGLPDGEFFVGEHRDR